MFDKCWFYFTKQTWLEKYELDIWLSKNLIIQDNEYVVFTKNNFRKVKSWKLQKWMNLLTESKEINFSFDKNFFIYWLVYYQRNLNQAIIKSDDIEILEMFENLFKNFWLELKLRKFIEIHWNYPNIEEITNLSKYADLNQAISFLLALAVLNGDWNLIEDKENIFLWNIVIKFPFDWAISEYKELIFNIEDILIENKIYNKIHFTKKNEIIWTIKDFDLLEVFWKAIFEIKELRNFFQLVNKVKTIFSKDLEILKKQLNTDLRINLDRFKLTEVEKISLKL